MPCDFPVGQTYNARQVLAIARDGRDERGRRAGAGETSHATVQDFLEDGRSDLLLTDANGPTKLFAGDLLSCESFGGSIVILDAPKASGLPFTVGQEATIAWRPFGGGVILADLDVSRDNGGTWRSIARGIAQRSFSWTVTPPLTTQGRIRVRLSTGFATDDASTNAFAWDGTDDGGGKVAAGAYFARGRWKGFAAERRFVWMP